MKRTVTGLVDAMLDQSGAFGFVSLKTTEGPLNLALPTEALHDLALLFLRLLGEGTKRGIVPPQLHPMMTTMTSPSATPTGILVSHELSDGLVLEAELPWLAARELADLLSDLCNEHDQRPSGLN